MTQDGNNGLLDSFHVQVRHDLSWFAEMNKKEQRRR